ncbi:hypothetical protein [Delftia lacustris]|uniref:hypothetical protein n=1 Tax=Delftia lacustris TaxID=558537 RepID=UPI0012E16B17|nr:hypothetical protein [Delftia lacustris]
MDERILRLWDKAEQAIDRNDNDQADSYRTLANTVAYQRRKEARSLERELYYLRETND